jgi:lipopolysaccharide/colanic/teichoic acid biosynthesis glycosyltransferase
MEPIDALSAVEGVLHADPQSRIVASEEPTTFLLSNTGSEPATIAATPVYTRPNELTGRCLDLVLGTLLLLLTLPLIGVCALAVILTSRGPVLFRQTRIGRDGREFKCLKFRTMVRNADAVFLQLLQKDEKAKHEWLAVQKLHDDPRVTRVGRFLRR